VPAGWIGEVHPAVAEQWDLADVSAFELDFAVLAAHAEYVPAYRDLTSYPEVRQDLAVIVGEDVPAEAVLAVVRREGGSLLEHAGVFDVYRGAQVGEGRVSLALRLAFRARDRTLTDEDVAAWREKIVSGLRELGGELRG
jgi:phenylalanyl-tRNA synthetase beta chain